MTSPSDLTQEERILQGLAQDLVVRMSYQTGGKGSWRAWSGVGQLDLTALIIRFGKLAPAFFQLQACDGHVAIRLFDDVVLIGIAQITPESWGLVHTIYTEAQADAALDLHMCAQLATDVQEPEVRDAATSVH